MYQEENRPSTLLACALAALLLFLPSAGAFAQAGDTATGLGGDRGRASIAVASRAQLTEGVGFVAAGSSDHVWALEARAEGKAAQPRGAFIVEQSFDWPSALDTAPADALGKSRPIRISENAVVDSMEVRLAVGTLRTAEGDESFVGLLRMDLAYRFDDVAYNESTLTPLFSGETLEEARTFGHELAETVAWGLAKRATAAAPLNKSICRVYCQMDHIDRIDSCTDRANACIGNVGAGALLCLGGCLTFAPQLLPACVALCLGSEALIIVSCLLEQQACIRDAGRELNSCLRDCPIPEL